MISDLYEIPDVARYLRRFKAETRGLYSAVVQEKRGAYNIDKARIEFDPETGEPKATEGYEPTDQEKQDIMATWPVGQFPEYVKPARPTNLPKELEEADADSVFEFKDQWGNIAMLQLRLDPKTDEAEKRYVPYTFWSDNKWRRAEPPFGLPLYGLDKIGAHTTVFIHEGAKAARAVQRLIEANGSHPWLEELRAGAHVGWAGGAFVPRRTNWNVLNEMGMRRAYIVSDNDKPGREAVAPISQMLRMQTFHLQFTDEWPAAFDLADPFPKKMFSAIEGKQIYVGPAFESCIHPATWMTDEVKQPKGKPIVILRPHVTDEWFYVDNADMFVNLERPHIQGSDKIINSVLSSFSNTSDTCKLILKKYSGRLSRLTYRPDVQGRKVTDDSTSAINMYVPPQIRPIAGDPTPFLEFMRYLFVNPEELDDVLRWCATLIAKPEIRMMYGLLLVSERQGVGKSTLTNRILAPLVGMNNVGFPTETDIVESQFNSWMANKRLVVVSEIYSGHSWKAYNKLKTYITDEDIMVNEKNQRRYKIENWSHYCCCSNSVKAMKIEDTDRRWLCPECTEVAWPAKKFKDFNSWIDAGGLGIILNWAQHYGEYVSKGEPAPMTKKKKEMIAASRTPEEVRAAELAERIIFEGMKVCITTRELELWAMREAKGKSFSTAHDLRKAMINEGMFAHIKRIRIAGNLQYVLVSPALYEEYKALFDEPEQNDRMITDLIRDNIKFPADLAGMQVSGVM
jgi:hypothetical protein